MNAAPACADAELLRKRYRADLRVYIEAAARLEKSDHFKSDYERAERARMTWEDSRAALNLHVAEHHCDTEMI